MKSEKKKKHRLSGHGMRSAQTNNSYFVIIAVGLPTRLKIDYFSPVRGQYTAAVTATGTKTMTTAQYDDDEYVFAEWTR